MTSAGKRRAPEAEPPRPEETVLESLAGDRNPCRRGVTLKPTPQACLEGVVCSADGEQNLLPALSTEARRNLAGSLRADARSRPVELFLNPVRKEVGVVTASMETARDGPPRYDLFLTLPAHAYAFSAFRHQTEGLVFEEPLSLVDTNYSIRLAPTDAAFAAGADSFAGQLRCSADGTQYTFCDDPSNFYSYPRELGAVVVLGERLSVLLPRVDPVSGAAAQFRVLREEDGIISRFFAGEARQHLMILSGVWSTRNGGSFELVYLNADVHERDDVVFRAKELNGALALQYSHPLCTFQAFCIALSLVHHQQRVHNQLAAAPSTASLRKVPSTAVSSSTPQTDIDLSGLNNDSRTYRL